MIIDHQDDLGTYLRQFSPELASSVFVKEASWQEKTEMMDRDFAIILVDPEGREHRKLAMQDAGNTMASIVYFLTRDHDLSDSAVKLASYNLLNSAMHYGLYDAYGDDFLFNEKLGSSAFDVLAALADNLDGKDIIDERRVGIRKEAMGPGMGYLKNAKTVAKTGPNEIPMGQGQMTNTVIKHASSYDLIKEAELAWADMDPVDKRQFAMVIKEAAEQEGAGVPDFIHQYTGNELNPQFEMIMKRRQDYTANEDLQSDYDRLAKVAHVMDLADATEALYLLDEQAGLLNRYGSNLPDPVLSVYGTTKEAMWSWNHGGEYCTARDLELMCHDPIKRKQFEDLFSEEICNEFRANPVKSFESRPIEQQILIARMANSTAM